MADKAGALLAGNEPMRDELPIARERFRAAFRWERVTSQYETMLNDLTRRRKAGRPRLIIDVSNAARDGANSGVVRVTRRLARELQRYGDPVFAVWNAEAGVYVFPNDEQYALLSAFNGPAIHDRLARSSAGAPSPVLGDFDWLLLTEVVLETDGKAIRSFARRHGLRIGAVFYDAIPFLRPDLVKDQVIRDNHASYMAGLGECDVVMPISAFSADCLKQFWSSQGIAGTTVTTVQLPGEFGGSDRCRDVGAMATTAVSILCVSTLEPRKNHVPLIEAMKRLALRRPDLPWTLTLIGNRYAGGDAIAQRVMDECAKDPRIRWLGIVDDATLHRAYTECTFTVYASEIEGFGMPILESLWHGKPCICHHGGVMAELAAAGGCLTVDVADGDALAGAVEAIATDNALRSRLANEAIRRPIKTWDTYSMEILRSIAKVEGGARPSDLRRPLRAAEEAAERAPSIFELLYPACLTSDWQMNDSERLGMTAVLHRLKPVCAIEVGTYKGGSLSLLAQYAKAVFSIDIDPTIPAKFAHFENVSFFTGPSGDVLPALLQELDAADLPVEFVLIDGDHSAAGVRRDIEIMLDYVPKRPLVLMLHDGFNPACRQGMLSAEWARSPHVHWVDLDFIPGRLVEHGGGGDGGMWGGLALALLAPARRAGSLVVGTSAGRAFAEMKERHYA
jgi:glycosyltransferase involved in cell wall biosynthesis